MNAHASRDGNKKRKRQQKKRYNRQNPPKDRDAALKKLDYLDSCMTSCEVVLKHKELESFPDDESYEIWRSRTIQALTHIKTEHRFLTGWLDTAPPKAPAQRAQQRPLQPKRVYEPERFTIRRYTKKRIDEIVSAHPILDDTRPCADPNDIRTELVSAQSALQEVNKLLQEVESLRAEHNVSKFEIADINQPLIVLARKARHAVIELQETIKTQTFTREVERCLNALQRASDDGHFLSDEEQDALENALSNLPS